VDAGINHRVLQTPRARNLLVEESTPAGAQSLTVQTDRPMVRVGFSRLPAQCLRLLIAILAGTMAHILPCPQCPM
jgi:hypothetical protein